MRSWLIGEQDTGVQSVTIAREDKNLLLVISVGIDSNRITKNLRRNVGPAEVVELRTLDHHQDGSNHPGDHHPYRYHPSPSLYKHPAARDLHHYNGRYQNAGGVYGHDYYGYGGGGGYQQGQYKQHDYFYAPPGKHAHGGAPRPRVLG